MLKTICISLLLAALWQPLFSQTTLEEYNYIAGGGYADHLSKGIDMKKGYSVKDMRGFESVGFGTEIQRGMLFKGFYREGDTLPCAIIATYERRDAGKTGYQEHFCIPAPLTGYDLWDRTYKQINAHYSTQNANDVFIAMTWALMKFASQEAGK